jgi:hypothetical protein
MENLFAEFNLKGGRYNYEFRSGTPSAGSFIDDSHNRSGAISAMIGYRNHYYSVGVNIDFLLEFFDLLTANASFNILCNTNTETVTLSPKVMFGRHFKWRREEAFNVIGYGLDLTIRNFHIGLTRFDFLGGTLKKNINYIELGYFFYPFRKSKRSDNP